MTTCFKNGWRRSWNRSTKVKRRLDPPPISMLQLKRKRLRLPDGLLTKVYKDIVNGYYNENCCHPCFKAGDGPIWEIFLKISLANSARVWGVSFDPIIIPARSGSNPISERTFFVLSTRFPALWFPSKYRQVPSGHVMIKAASANVSRAFNRWTGSSLPLHGRGKRRMDLPNSSSMACLSFSLLCGIFWQ